MKVSNISLTDDNHFIAMEYYGLILNRTYLIILLEGYLLGLVCNELIASDIDTDSGYYNIGMRKLMKALVRPLVISGDLNSRFSYMRKDILEKYSALNLLSDFKLVHKANFKCEVSNILSISHDPSNKWGMGGYPHDGKIYIKTDKFSKELIILGNQSGKEIVRNINTKQNRANGTDETHT